MLLKRFTFIPYNHEVIKRAHRMWLLVCYDYFTLHYALFDPGDTLSFLTPILTMKFNIQPDILTNPFSVSTPVGDFVVAKRVYIGCPSSLANIVTLVNLIKLYFILGVDWFYACIGFINCRTSLVKFQFPNEPSFSGRDETQIVVVRSFVYKRVTPIKQHRWNKKLMFLY